MPTNAEWLLDTSAAVALVLPGAEWHAAVTERTRGATLGLAGHAQFETYSALTRLPGALRLDAAAAHRLIVTNFPASAFLAPPAVTRALAALAEAGVSGGAVYDGLVALAAVAAGLPLLSCDRRALSTYKALAVRYEML